MLTDPSFPRSISSASTPLVIRAWWKSSTGYVADLELPPPPPELAVSSGWGGASRSPTVLDCYLLQSERTIRETSISPGIFATLPHPTSLCPAMVCTGHSFQVAV